ncbi:MAG TPA: SRPBCC family protein [Bryobacteraceae bacterium]|nr:SRPBCC family protein [Bryobacteraceae bacterium]
MNRQPNRTRRQLIVGSLAGFGSLAISSAQVPKTIIDTKAIHHEVDFAAAPQRIYDALLDEKQFKAFSGMAAQINREAGGAFSIFEGHIVGRNLELVPARRIVQAWRVVPWPKGVYSIARFEFEARGSGTRLTFDHTGFPSEEAEHLEIGWQDHYWKALRVYLG